MSTPVLDDLATAQQHLAQAVRELLQPATAHLGRDGDDPDTDEREHAARLERRHADALRRRDHAGARRALAALMDLRRRLDDPQRTRARLARQAHLPSLLEQLQDAVQSRQGHGGGTAGPHRSPIGLDAADLLAEIRRTVAARLEQDLSVRLRSWASLAGHWRASDPQRLLRAAGDVQEWVRRARVILDPPRPLDLAAACPECDARTVHVLDSGEWVRRPALQVDRVTGTAYCQACGESWPPERLQLLAAVLEQQAKQQAERDAYGRLSE